MWYSDCVIVIIDCPRCSPVSSLGFSMSRHCTCDQCECNEHRATGYSFRKWLWLSLGQAEDTRCSVGSIMRCMQSSGALGWGTEYARCLRGRIAQKDSQVHNTYFHAEADLCSLQLRFLLRYPFCAAAPMLVWWQCHSGQHAEQSSEHKVHGQNNHPWFDTWK